MSHVDFLKWQYRMSLLLIFHKCDMSNLRNSHVSCHFLCLPPCRISLSLMSHVEFKKIPCCSVEFMGQGPDPVALADSLCLGI